MVGEGIHVIDCHQHVGDIAAVARKGTPGAETENYQEAELEARLTTMATRGFDQAILLPGHGYLRPQGNVDTMRVNDELAAYRDRDPAHFPAALGVVEPLHGELSFQELHRIKDELGLAGVSFHARFQGVATNSRYVLDLAVEIGRLGLIPYVHAAAPSKDEDWWKIQEFAECIPDVPVVALDAFDSSEKSWEAVRVAVKTPNIYFDTSMCSSMQFVLPVIEEVGAERVIFGTDLYSSLTPNPPGAQRTIIDQIVDADYLTLEDKRNILGENIRRLLQLGPQA
ncbi:MAG: amidohydrolase family protein [Actinomycetota bacterium]